MQIVHARLSARGKILFRFAGEVRYSRFKEVFDGRYDQEEAREGGEARQQQAETARQGEVVPERKPTTEAPVSAPRLIPLEMLVNILARTMASRVVARCPAYPRESVEDKAREMLTGYAALVLDAWGDAGYFPIPESRDPAEDRAIVCLRCGAVSYNPHDVQARYCGRCHVLHERRDSVRQ